MASIVGVSSLYQVPSLELSKRHSLPLSFKPLKLSSTNTLPGPLRTCLFVPSAIATPNSSVLSEEAFKGIGNFFKGSLEDDDDTDFEEDQFESESEEAGEDELAISNLGLPLVLAESLKKSGITHLFPIQREVLLPALKGQDIIARAKTGTGKTLAFGIPIIKRPTEVRSSLVASVKTSPELLKIMISGAPASGKGTQCELITKKYGLVHISAGDLLRAEVAAGSENGKRAKEYMEKGKLVPNEIVVMMVKDRLLQPDSQEHGWLLDGYPRSFSQAKALEDLGIHPDLFILLDVPEEILVERVIGRRLDPVTGRIYHLTYSPPETEEIAARITQRFDDTEEKVRLRLETHNQNVEDVLSIYKDVTVKIDGSVPKEDVFVQIDRALSGLVEQKKPASTSAKDGV